MSTGLQLAVASLDDAIVFRQAGWREEGANMPASQEGSHACGDEAEPVVRFEDQRRACSRNRDLPGRLGRLACFLGGRHAGKSPFRPHDRRVFRETCPSFTMKESCESATPYVRPATGQGRDIRLERSRLRGHTYCGLVGLRARRGDMTAHGTRKTTLSPEGRRLDRFIAQGAASCAVRRRVLSGRRVRF